MIQLTVFIGLLLNASVAFSAEPIFVRCDLYDHDSLDADFLDTTYLGDIVVEEKSVPRGHATIYVSQLNSPAKKGSIVLQLKDKGASIDVYDFAGRLAGQLKNDEYGYRTEIHKIKIDETTIVKCGEVIFAQSHYPALDFKIKKRQAGL